MLRANDDCLCSEVPRFRKILFAKGTVLEFAFARAANDVTHATIENRGERNLHADWTL